MPGIKKMGCLLICLVSVFFASGQFLMDMIDTTKETGKGLLNIISNYDHLVISGYLQPQFQVASSQGIQSYEGGDFSPRVNNRFMLRRSRIKLNYYHKGKNNLPGVQFVFQIDASERSVGVRDAWGRLFENKFQVFAFTTGIFARPFGFEVNYSSSDRESPERGRMSQILMKSERDLGAMISFEPRRETHPLKKLKIDAGIFNGQGIAGPADIDNAKDFIGRIALKPISIKPQKIIVAAGVSLLYGGINHISNYRYFTAENAGIKSVHVDSSLLNIGKISPRRYYGADVQLKIKTHAGFTALRGEYIAGKQSATAASSETPATIQLVSDGLYRRNFNGAYFYLLRHIFSSKHQLLVKYDWYDPNTLVEKNEIGRPGAGFTATDIRYRTLGVGYIYYLTGNLRVTLYYASVRNEKTALPGFTSDVSDDVFTCRFHYSF